ncbi:MAG TPA: S1/P1 nuclease [Terriglobales bacterium]
MRRTRIATALLVLLAFILQTNVAAWGGEGHRIIANIAEVRLTPNARAQVQVLLDGAHLADIAVWADDIRRDHPETSRWHYVDIPYEASNYDAARDCQATDHGDCVIAEIARAEKVLADTSQSKQDRADSLKFLVHFVGDMHQPLHAIERKDPISGAGDQGGNAVRVTFFGSPASLHAVWDSGIVTHGGVMLDQVQNWLATQDEKALAQGEPVQWALAAHNLAVSNTYVLPADLQLGDEYVKKNVPIVIAQLGSAGVRLAAILNRTLGQPPAAH